MAYEMTKGGLAKDGRAMLSLIRTHWGDEAPSHAELDAARAHIEAAVNALPALLAAARAALELLTVGKAAQCLDVNPYSLPAVSGLAAAIAVAEGTGAGEGEGSEPNPPAKLVHLLPLPGVGTACGAENSFGIPEATPEINEVTCPDCIAAHDDFMAEQDEEG